VCYSNFFRKSRRFSDIQLQKMSRLWIQGQRSLKVMQMVPFDILCLVSYYCSIVSCP